MDGVAKKAAPVEVDDTAMFERRKPTLQDSLAQTKKVSTERSNGNWTLRLWSIYSD